MTGRIVSSGSGSPKVLAVLAMSVAVVTAGCVGGPGGDASDGLTGEVRIAGSSTVYPISVAVAEEFNKEHPGVQVPVQSTGTGGGFENFFVPGKTDINGASRRIEESELEAARANGIEPLELQVATDAITVLVNPEAEWVDDVTVEELRQIWRPEDPARRWSDVRPEWPDEEIELYGPTSASGTFDYFTEEIVGEEGASRGDFQGTEQDNTIVQAVSRDRYAMGYLGMAYYLENQGKVKALKVNGVEPGIETAKSGEYRPLSRPLFIYVNEDSLDEEAVREFVEFYIEQTDTDLIGQIGYVPVTSDVKRENLRKLENAVEGDG
ncbi:MAG: hypothetical protein MAG715_00659 [Methanonatronarchaeales archaeon]|nr:hypothetical protein [Methanonatronarchaeales archaeon]